MNAETLFLDHQAEGESLILPLLLVTLTFGVFFMSTTPQDKLLSQTLESQKITSTTTDTRRNIIDIIWSCSPQSLLEKSSNCGN